MSKEKFPSFQFYPGDWRKDPGVQALTYHDRGVWFEMILLMHESEERGVLLLNGQPMPEEALARVLGLDKQNLTTTLTTLLTYGVAKRRPEDGAIYSNKMVRDEQIRKIRAQAGKKGGNPVLLNQNSTTQDNQNPTPSSSSSSSSSSSDLSKNPPISPLVEKTDSPVFAFVPPATVDPSAWKDLDVYRKSTAKLRKGWTDVAKGKSANLLARYSPEQQREIVDTSIRNNWVGVFEPKGNGNGSNRKTFDEYQAMREQRIQQAIAEDRAERESIDREFQMD